MNRPPSSSLPILGRRALLGDLGMGFTGLALSAMLHRDGFAASGGGRPGLPHFAPRAKRVIWLFMNGGQSQVDTFDYKPELAKRDGKEFEGFDKNTGFFTAQVGPLMKSPFSFRQYGQSGAWVSEIFPFLAQHVDDLLHLLVLGMGEVRVARGRVGERHDETVREALVEAFGRGVRAAGEGGDAGDLAPQPRELGEDAVDLLLLTHKVNLIMQCLCDLED